MPFPADEVSSPYREAFRSDQLILDVLGEDRLDIHTDSAVRWVRRDTCSCSLLTRRAYLPQERTQ